VAGRFSTTVRRSYFRRGQHAVLVPTAEIKPHDALRMSQGRKSSLTSFIAFREPEDHLNSCESCPDW
jgi:hypothetical protein